MQRDSVTTSDHQPADTRRVWVAPHYSRMQAGDAEQGANPDMVDEGFTRS